MPNNLAQENPIPRSTGIFIPTEIADRDDLSLFEERLLSIVHIYYSEKHGGCFASNEYLAKKMKNAKVNTIAKALVHLRKLGLIEDVSFNGRQRVIRACIGEAIVEAQSKAALDKNPRQGMTKIQGGSASHIYDKKEDKKDIGGKPPANAPPKYFSFGKKIKIKKEEYEALIKDFGDPLIQKTLGEMDDYLTIHGKKYQDYARAIRAWIKRGSGEQNKTANSRATNEEIANQLAHDTRHEAKKRSVRVETFPDRVEIYSTHPTSTIPAMIIKYQERGFAEQLENALRKWRLKP